MTNFDNIVRQLTPEILADLFVGYAQLSHEECPDNCFVKPICVKGLTCTENFKIWLKADKEVNNEVKDDNKDVSSGKDDVQ